MFFYQLAESAWLKVCISREIIEQNAVVFEGVVGFELLQ